MDVTHDAALGGRLRLTQPKRGHRFGHDAILLAAAVPAKSGERVVEFGAGVGAAGLAVAARVPGISLTLLEIEPYLTALASENIAANGFSDRARTLTVDVTDLAALDRSGIGTASADHVLMNPPFNDAALQASPDPLRRKAHGLEPGALPKWIASAATVLRPGGTLTLIWRAEGWPVAERALGGAFGKVSVLPIHSIEGEAAIRVICTAVRGAASTSARLPGFVLNGRDHRPTPAAEAVLREGAALTLAAQ